MRQEVSVRPSWRDDDAEVANAVDILLVAVAKAVRVIAQAFPESTCQNPGKMPNPREQKCFVDILALAVLVDANPIPLAVTRNFHR
jgi:hypothetical protein